MTDTAEDTGTSADRGRRRTGADPGRGHRHPHRAGPDVRDRGADHPGGPDPHLEERAGHPPVGTGAVGPPRGQGLPGLRGRAGDLRRALRDRRLAGSRPGRPVRHQQGRPGGHRHAEPARVGGGVLGHHLGRRGGGPDQRLVDGSGARLRAARLGHLGGVRGRGTRGPDPPPSGRAAQPPGGDRHQRGAPRYRRAAGGDRVDGGAPRPRAGAGGPVHRSGRHPGGGRRPSRRPTSTPTTTPPSSTPPAPPGAPRGRSGPIATAPPT